MTQLPPPATGTELYLHAIHEELRALRVALVDGGGEPAHEAADPTPPAPAGAPTKRTRTRPRPGG